jgi:hypothetical protein
MSEDAAYRRITAARAARRSPAIFPMVADGRLHLTAVLLLAPYLTRETADGLLRVAVGKTKEEIQRLLAERFPQSEELPMVEALPRSLPALDELALARVGMSKSGHEQTRIEAGGPDATVSRIEAAGPEAAAHVAPAAPRSTVSPIAPQRFAMHVTMSEQTREKLRHAQELLSHQVAVGDIAEVLDRALDALIAQLERRKFAATDRPRPERRPITNERTIPANVRRAVWRRDGGRCTFVSDTGTRCASRSRLEYDHIEPVARGGEATVDNVRLRCRAHNQHEAERLFGVEFMAAKRRAGA